MPRTRNPRKGSMQFWPRKRAKRHFNRIRTWHQKKEATPLGFAGYKAGMTQLIVEDNYANSMTKGMRISIPVTLIECPPIKVAGISLYKQDSYGLKQSSSFILPNNKELTKNIPIPKKTKKIEDLKTDGVIEARLIVYTQPRKAIGKKKPDLFELGIGGSIQDKLEYAKQALGKEIKVSDIFKEGQQVDIHAVTKGKGFQGPVKRFGVAIRHHKAEKTKRGPGTLGPWHGRTMERVAHAGQMGYHQRIDANKQIIKIDENFKNYNIKGGFIRYGNLSNTIVAVKGSVIGPKKRIIKLTFAQRPNKQMPTQAPKIISIKTESQQ